MGKTVNTQEYVHRLKFCLRVVKLLNLGEVEVYTPNFKPIYQIKKGEHPLYTFYSLDAFERFAERSCAAHTALGVPDKVITRRMNLRRKERIARADGQSSYLIPSAM